MTFLRRYGIPILGAVLVAVGFISMSLWQPSASFGWTSYVAEPTTSLQFEPVASVGELLGQAAVVTGFVLLAGWVGYGIGRRSKSIASRES